MTFDSTFFLAYLYFETPLDFVGNGFLIYYLLKSCLGIGSETVATSKSSKLLKFYDVGRLLKL